MLGAKSIEFRYWCAKLVKYGFPAALRAPPKNRCNFDKILATPAEKLGDNAVNGLAWLTALSRLYTDKGFLSAVANRSALAIPHISPPMRRLDRRQHYHRHGAIQRMSGHAIAIPSMRKPAARGGAGIEGGIQSLRAIPGGQ